MNLLSTKTSEDMVPEWGIEKYMRQAYSEIVGDVPAMVDWLRDLAKNPALPVHIKDTVEDFCTSDRLTLWLEDIHR